MTLRTLFVTAVGALLAVSAGAIAPASATTWNWQVTGAGADDGSGTISGSVSCGVGCFVITQATGEIAGDTITGISTFANQFGAPDDFLFPSAADPSQIDILGISFAVSGPLLGTAVNIFHDTGFNIDKLDPQNGTGEVFGDFMIVGVAATPLPATLSLFAGGLGMVGFLARRKKRKAEKALAA